MNVSSHRTSFFALTGDGESADLTVSRVEIPLFQRDYAQGRDTESVQRIRNGFLDVLRTAVTAEAPTSVGLDFVYGGIKEGTLRPLDGQQRLTTLFLLHWYVASRSNELTGEHHWTRFSYATRPSARMFCESLVENPLQGGTQTPSTWIEDQPWYLFLWRHDPSIQSMLVMLDAIHEHFKDVDAKVAWERLTDAQYPAIWFLVLPISDIGSAADEEMRSEHLYIKMNSRGKPLTDFENFKAQFEKTIEWSSKAHEFAVKVDTVWSDLFWGLRGDDDLIDDELLRYLQFVTQICEWRDGSRNGAKQHLSQRAREVFGAQNPSREEHLKFLFQALDTWVGRSIPDTFDSFFTDTSEAKGTASKVRLFFRQDGTQNDPVNLFEACCRSYGESRGGDFSLGQVLTLYAVLIHLIEKTDEFPLRSRVLRNLIEASSSELRIKNMPEILEDVDHVIRSGNVALVGRLNEEQAEEEKLKASFLEEHPELRGSLARLEDHELLRGSLRAFAFEPATFDVRATEFHDLMSSPNLWPELLGALLATGEYQRPRSNKFLFGTNSKEYASAWRDLLTGTSRESMRSTREVLLEFLDRCASAPTEMPETLATITNEYLGRCESEQRFDWRYYMVKYPAMRGNGSSTYCAEPENSSEIAAMGFSLCMLQPRGVALNGNYWDPYLLAITEQLEDSSIVETKWFTGYVTAPRWLPLARSGASIRCVPAGFELLQPPPGLYSDEFTTACATLGLGTSNSIMVPQIDSDGRRFDAVDRIQVGADVIRTLAAAGL